jgi:hypothetical protein
MMGEWGELRRSSPTAARVETRQILTCAIDAGSRTVQAAHRETGMLSAYKHFILFVGAASLAAGVPSIDASEPCDSEPSGVCGRLVIQIVAAGENPNPNPYKKGTAEYEHFDPLDFDGLEFDALTHLAQFSPNARGTLPVRVVSVASDDAYAKKAASSLGKKRGLDRTFQGIIPNSLESFSDLISSPTSPLNRAIKTFEDDVGCKKLMVQHNLSSVLPLLKIEELIETEGEGMESLGIPTWSGKRMKGSTSDWFQDGSSTIDAAFWKSLRQRTKGALHQTIINSCKAGLLATVFERSAEEYNDCACFVASTNQVQNDFSGGSFNPTFVYGMDRTGSSQSEGNGSIVGMTAALYGKFRSLIFPKSDESDPNTIISVVNERNPLSAFVYNSADALAEEGFQKLANLAVEPVPPEKVPADEELNRMRHSDNMADSAKAAYFAQTMSELPKQEFHRIKSDDVSDMLDEIDRAFKDLFDRQGESLTAAGFNKEVDLFYSCQEAGPLTSSACAEFIKAMDRLYDKESPTNAEVEFKVANDEFFEVKNEAIFEDVWKNYIGKELTTSEVFQYLSKVRTAFKQVRREIAAVSRTPENKGQKDVELGANEMISHFDNAYESIRSQLFSELRKDAIQLKWAKIRLATNMVAANAATLPPDYSDQFSKRMLSKLKCLTKIPVGPKFDEQPPGPLKPYRLVISPPVELEYKKGGYTKKSVSGSR